ncbi:MAG: DUF883 family protein [Iodobacter sp.]
MFGSNNKPLDVDYENLVKKAQELLQEAASLTGDKADEVRGQAMELLDNVLGTPKSGPERMVCSCKKMVGSACGCVKTHPWNTLAAVAGIGLLLGIIFRRK